MPTNNVRLLFFYLADRRHNREPQFELSCGDTKEKSDGPTHQLVTNRVTHEAFGTYHYATKPDRLTTERILRCVQCSREPTTRTLYVASAQKVSNSTPDNCDCSLAGPNFVFLRLATLDISILDCAVRIDSVHVHVFKHVQVFRSRIDGFCRSGGDFVIEGAGRSGVRYGIHRTID